MDSCVIWIENDTLWCNGGGSAPPIEATAYHQDSTTDGARGVMRGVGEQRPPPRSPAYHQPISKARSGSTTAIMMDHDDRDGPCSIILDHDL